MSRPPETPSRPDLKLAAEGWIQPSQGDRPAFAAQLVDLNLVEERVRGALAILQAIDEGELLSGAPAEADARERHEIGVSLLGVQKEVLLKILEDLKA